MQQTTIPDDEVVRWLLRQWRQRSVLTRTSIFFILLLEWARRLLWLYTTPQNFADIPRAIFIIDVYLVVCWVALAFLMLLIFSLLREAWRYKMQHPPTVIEKGC